MSKFIKDFGSKRFGLVALAFDNKANEPVSMEIIEKIQELAKGRFDGAAFEEFLQRFSQLSSHATIIDSILQVSTDEGDELEIGFFTSDTLVDITLSNGEVYSCSYPLSSVKTLALSDKGSKWTLTIIGEKKFDYNVVKPASIDLLKKYEKSLRRHLASSHEQ